MGPLALCDFCQLAPYIEILLLTVTYLLTIPFQSSASQRY